MPNLYVACWTMSERIFEGASKSGRVDMLHMTALLANTELTNMGAGGGTRMLIVPEYVFTAGGSILSRNDKHKIYRKLENISAQVPNLYLIAGTIAYEKGVFSKNTYNVCPVLHNGAIIKKLYKAGDDGHYQINGSFKTKNDNGKAVPLFNVNGISMGIDICMDFNAERLGNYIANNNLNRPDVHVHISGTNMTGTPSAQARAGGIYIHCDLGGKGSTGATAWKVTAQNGNLGAATTRILPADTLMANGGRLMFFDASF